MLVIWILTAILQALGVDAAIQLWAWFGSHVLLTILMILFFG